MTITSIAVTVNKNRGQSRKANNKSEWYLSQDFLHDLDNSHVYEPFYKT